MLAEMGLSVWSPLQPSGDGSTEGPIDQKAANQARSVLVAEPPRSAATPRPPVKPRPPTTRPATAPTLTAAPTPIGIPHERPSGLDQMNWQALKQAVTNCHACKLCEGRTQTVFGAGSTRAQWMIVGEAPGAQEDRQGEPLVGKAGQLLDSMLRAMGLTRLEAQPDGAPVEPARHAYIASAVKCRPPGNRNPEPEELAQCEPFLIRQLELLRPRIILAMGRSAVQSLLRSHEPIGRLRGRVHDYHGVSLVVTYDPAYLLRNPEDKAKAWDDLCLALRAARQSTG